MVESSWNWDTCQLSQSNRKRWDSLRGTLGLGKVWNYLGRSLSSLSVSALLAVAERWTRILLRKRWREFLSQMGLDAVAFKGSVVVNGSSLWAKKKCIKSAHPSAWSGAGRSGCSIIAEEMRQSQEQVLNHCWGLKLECSTSCGYGQKVGEPDYTN